MISLTFITADGVRITTEGRPGLSLMEAARAADVPGIVAECGGGCACATCHVYLAPEDFARLPPAESMETELLEFAPDSAPERSRLSCQIRLEPALDGLTITVPARQG